MNTVIQIGMPITTDYSARRGVIRSIRRRRVSDFVSNGVLNQAFLVEFSPFDENGIANFDFYGYTTKYLTSNVPTKIVGV